MILAFLILLGFAAAFVGMIVDVDRLLRREAELDALWDDEVGADGVLWASSDTVGADDLLGGAA